MGNGIPPIPFITPEEAPIQPVSQPPKKDPNRRSGLKPSNPDENPYVTPPDSVSPQNRMTTNFSDDNDRKTQMMLIAGGAVGAIVLYKLL